jgi:hypothetical protein
MRLLDIEARRFELVDPSELERADKCGKMLLAFDLQNPERMRRLRSSIKVPDDYVTAYRWFGAYSLTRVPFAAGVKRHETERLKQFSFERSEIDKKVAYEIGEKDLENLYHTYAPTFIISHSSNADLPGALEWQSTNKGLSVGVNITKPVMYTQSTLTRYGELNLRQLIYTIWFSERPVTKGASIDLLAGKLDGLMVRVTLAPNGDVLIYDSIHPCGCYHEFYPTSRAIPKLAPTGLDEWAFSPVTLPAWQQGDRLLVHVASGTHYIDRVEFSPRGRSDIRSFAQTQVELKTLAYNSIRALPTGDGATRSAFDPRGFIHGSERLESWLFWPMGIANAGAMRQWGRQATAFVGRRHFDDPRLMEERFTFDLR